MIDTFLKLTQAGFYIVGGTVAVLTYRAAKIGLLNTVNTEYHKKVIDRLEDISSKLIREFDHLSSDHWIHHDSTKEVIAAVNKEAKIRRHELLTKGPSALPGTLRSSTEIRLYSEGQVIKSDPFIPEAIRNEIFALLNGRSEALMRAHLAYVKEYKQRLSEGSGWDTMDDNHSYIHNQINAQLYKDGFGIAQVEEKVSAIRSSIQTFYAEFDPSRKNQSFTLVRAREAITRFRSRVTGWFKSKPTG